MPMPDTRTGSRRPNDGGRSGTMIMVGDTFHNFVDGVLIAASFLADPQLGIVTALAIIAHEIPQEVGDFLVLLNSGFRSSRRSCLIWPPAQRWCWAACLAMPRSTPCRGWVPYLLGFVAAGMIYVSVADLIPGLHRRPELKATLASGGADGTRHRYDLAGAGADWPRRLIACRSRAA